MAKNGGSKNGEVSVVLVHGAFVDGAGWEGVYKTLKKDGYDVSVVQHSTLSLKEDVALTKQAIAAQKHDVLLVGHSYGGVVITEAVNDPKVAGLVSGASFVVVHPDPRHWPALSVVSAVLSGLRVASGSLLPCLGLHVAFNAAGVLALVTGNASATHPLEVPPTPLVASWLAAGLLLVVLLRLANNPGASRARAEDRA